MAMPALLRLRLGRRRVMIPSSRKRRPTAGTAIHGQAQPMRVLALARHGIKQRLGRPAHLVAQVGFGVADGRPRAAGGSRGLAGAGDVGGGRGVVGILLGWLMSVVGWGGWGACGGVDFGRGGGSR